MLNDLSPLVNNLNLETVRNALLEEHSVTGSMWVEKFSEIGKARPMQGFKSNKKQLTLNTREISV